MKKKIRICLKSFDFNLINRSIIEIINITKRTESIVYGPVPFPTRIQKFSILRSPHVNKSSFDQFEIRIYKRLIDIKNVTNRTIDIILKLDLPAGVDFKIKI